MRQLALQLLLRQCERAIGALLLLAFVRLGYIAYQQRPAQVTYSPVPKEVEPRNQGPQTPPGIPPGLLERLRMRPAPLPSELLAQELAPSAQSGTSPPKPQVTRIYVAIHQGPVRSEIRLNGVTLGQTPYVGEIRCTHGEPLEFILIPPKGLPRRSLHTCDRTEITITDKPASSTHE